MFSTICPMCSFFETGEKGDNEVIEQASYLS